MQIVLCSDNHGDRKSLDIILARHPGADLYLHCGDSEFSKDMLMPFASVRGNNDYDYSFPKYRVVETKHHNIYITHGNLYYSNISELTKAAKKEDCDVVFYGHTHSFLNLQNGDVHLVNPGSTFYNRDMSDPCYAIVNFDDETGEISVERHTVYVK